MHQLGFTRSANRRDHLLQTPDTVVRTPLPGLSGGTAIVHAAPEMGAGFAMMTVEFEPDGTLLEGPTQRFLYVVEGNLVLREPGSPRPRMLAPGSFAYLPMEHPHMLLAQSAARVLVIDKPFVPLGAPEESAPRIGSRTETPTFLLGSEDGAGSSPLYGDEGVQVRALVSDSMAFDFAVNTMRYDPGASLAQVEVHYMEHGLLMLEGGGIYRLGDSWYPVQAGDFIWMKAFCPQWFGCIGKQAAKYLIYKDFNRHVLA